MELRQLQTFTQIAQMQSFSRTAEMLGYSQSAVTVQIRQLENELGKRLFDRTGKKVVLTPQGEEFLEHANRILYDVHQAKASMNDTDELKNPLHIGTIESLCTVKFPKIIRKFREQYPRVSIRITVDSPEKLIQMMEHNELDLIYSGYTKMGQQLDQGDGEGRTGYVCDISQSPAGKRKKFIA